MHTSRAVDVVMLCIYYSCDTMRILAVMHDTVILGRHCSSDACDEVTQLSEHLRVVRASSQQPEFL